MKKVLFWMMVLMTSLCFISCEKSDKNVSSQSNEEKNWIEAIVPNNGYISFYHGKTIRLTFSDGKISGCKISDVGEINRLNQITNIPKTGWRDNSIEIKIGHGYVVEYGDLSDYCRLIIIEYIDRGAVGAYRIQYERWNPFTGISYHPY